MKFYFFHRSLLLLTSVKVLRPFKLCYAVRHKFQGKSFFVKRSGFRKIGPAVFLILITSCALLPHHSTIEVAEALVGMNSLNCGEVHIGNDATNVNECVLDMLQKNESFYAWYWLQPIDSEPATGILLRDGELLIAWYDSFGNRSNSFSFVTSCLSWTLKRDATKPIICRIRQGTEVYLFELEPLVEIVFTET